jgi:hypothetical protein
MEADCGTFRISSSVRNAVSVTTTSGMVATAPPVPDPVPAFCAKSAEERKKGAYNEILGIRYIVVCPWKITGDWWELVCA